jgi:hypothetical protein
VIARKQLVCYQTSRYNVIFLLGRGAPHRPAVSHDRSLTP